MPRFQDDAFEQFAVQRKRDLQRIARHTRRKHELDDVVNEAWILACSLLTREGGTLDLTDAAGQKRLLSHLYQHLVRYTELTVRRAVRLDHAPGDAGQDDEAHPLTYLLVSQSGRHPLTELREQEAAAASLRRRSRRRCGSAQRRGGPARHIVAAAAASASAPIWLRWPPLTSP
jgi:hypothetical protein